MSNRISNRENRKYVKWEIKMQLLFNKMIFQQLTVIFNKNKTKTMILGKTRNKFVKKYVKEKIRIFKLKAVYFDFC